MIGRAEYWWVATLAREFVNGLNDSNFHLDICGNLDNGKHCCAGDINRSNPIYWRTVGPSLMSELLSRSMHEQRRS